MERSSITKWLFLGLAVVLFVTVGWPLLSGSGSTKQPFLGLGNIAAPAKPNPEVCTLQGVGFTADVSERDAALQHLRLTGRQYTLSDADPLRGRAKGDPIDVVSTTLPERMPLRTDLRTLGNPDEQQVKFTDFDWTLDKAQSTEKTCVFTYKDDTTALTKTISTTET